MSAMTSHPEWYDYTRFRMDMIARQREAERHGLEPTIELLGMEPWPPDWEALDRLKDVPEIPWLRHLPADWPYGE